MSEFDIDRTTAEDRVMKAVRRSRIALAKAGRIARVLSKVDIDYDGNTYAGGKMPGIAENCENYSAAMVELLKSIEKALDRKLAPTRRPEDD